MLNRPVDNLYQPFQRLVDDLFISLHDTETLSIEYIEKSVVTHFSKTLNNTQMAKLLCLSEEEVNVLESKYGFRQIQSN